MSPTQRKILRKLNAKSEGYKAYHSIEVRYDTINHDDHNFFDEVTPYITWEKFRACDDFGDLTSDELRTELTALVESKTILFCESGYYAK